MINDKRVHLYHLFHFLITHQIIWGLGQQNELKGYILHLSL